jgi:hypothetical protein
MENINEILYKIQMEDKVRQDNRITIRLKEPELSFIANESKYYKNGVSELVRKILLEYIEKNKEK